MSNNMRCPWCGENEIYVKYHDEEWGVPCMDDRKQYEFLVLESAQAGLSWLTILKRRENYRKAFAGFDYEAVSKFGENEFNRLLNNPEIIRNRLKISAAINNARMFIKVRDEFKSFSNYIWSFVNNKPLINKWKTLSELPAKTDLSDKISNDLKKRGFRFIGSTMIYSHLQALGIVNDHLIDCFRYSEIISNYENE